MENEILKELAAGNAFSVTKSDTDETKSAVNNLIKYGLVKKHSKGRLEITDDGYNAHDTEFNKWVNQKNDSALFSTEKENLELQKLRSENIILVNDLVELPKIKSQRNWLFIIAILELLAILAGLILQWTKRS